MQDQLNKSCLVSEEVWALLPTQNYMLLPVKHFAQFMHFIINPFLTKVV